MSRGSLGEINCREDFCPSAFPLFPQREGLSNSILLALYSSAFNRQTDEGLLVGREMYFHRFRLGTDEWGVNDLRQVCAPVPVGHLLY